MAAPFPASSRYALVETTTLEQPDGRTTAYLRRRFVPQPEGFTTFGIHTVSQGERLDTVTYAHLGDPQLFWRVADANRAMRPDDLMEIGRALRITFPEGITGATGA
jgi:hypothetical protein